MRILVVDDDPVSLAKISVCLKDYGECDMVMTGEEAILAFEKAHHEGQPYKLMTLDIKLPDMYGQEVLAYVHKWELDHKFDEIGERIKVIMVTALNDMDFLMKSFQQGCSAYLTKPFNVEDIRGAMSKIGFTRK